MNSSPNLSLISIVLIAVAAFLAAEAGPVRAQSDAAEFKQGCMKGCVRVPAHKEVCNRQCDCMMSELREGGNVTSYAQLKLPEADAQRINLICTGVVGVALMTQTCNENCQADPTCLRTCTCISVKIRENRTREQVGAFFSELAENAAALNQLQNACVKP